MKKGTMYKISKNITYLEAINSHTAREMGIDNVPSPEHLASMIITARMVFQPIRDHFNVPIRVNSFYRNPVVNRLIGGSATSDHMTGRAIDLMAIDGTGITNMDIFNWSKENLDFDQLINEHPDMDGVPSWVHISYRENGNRNQVFTIL